MQDALTGQTVELLQGMIRNGCVNDGSAASGQEVRNVDLLEGFLGRAGFDAERFEAAPGRVSLVARMEGRERDAPSLCLMGHTDVVPVNPAGWAQDPYGGELVDGEVWGRGAIDMLNLTASMAVAFRRLATTGFEPRGDLIFFAVADEESGGAFGARWMANHHPDAIRASYVLTEQGGLQSGPDDRPWVTVNVAEKGVAWRRLRIYGEPGHGSMPYRRSNALVKAAAVVQRLSEYRSTPRLGDLWRDQVAVLEIEDDVRQGLLDPLRLDDVLSSMEDMGNARHLHACTHTTFSPDVISGTTKINVIPDGIELDVDIRTLPGEGQPEVEAHLREALGDLSEIDVEIILDDPASRSDTETPLWESLKRAVAKQLPAARLTPQMTVGFTDARIFRQLGAVAYGAGLLSRSVSGGEFSSRFHGNDERIDLESLRLTTNLWLDVVRDLLG